MFHHTVQGDEVDSASGLESSGVPCSISSKTDGASRQPSNDVPWEMLSQNLVGPFHHTPGRISANS